MNPSGYQDLLNREVDSASLVLLTLDPSSVPYVDSSQTLQDYILTNGQFVIGSSGNDPVPGTLTPGASMSVVNGPGTITVDTVQPIGPTANPTFQSVTVTGLSASSVVGTDATDKLQSLTPASTTGMLTTVTGGNLNINTPQDLRTTAIPSFNDVILTGTAVNRPVFTNGSNALVTSPPITNGQLIIGRTGLAPVCANLTGTANQLIVTNGSGTITLSTPQNTATSSSPTFTGLTLSGLTPNLIVQTNGTSQLLASTIPLGTAVSGVLPIANGGSNSSTALTNGKLMISNSGAIVEGTSSSSPSFTNLTVSSLTANRPVFSDGSNVLVSSPSISNGQIIIGRTGLSPLCNTITGTANQVLVTNGSGSITLSLPQSIDTAATVQFGQASIQGTSPAVRVVNTASNTNRATVQLNGTNGTLGNFNIQQDNGGNAVLENVGAIGLYPGSSVVINATTNQLLIGPNGGNKYTFNCVAPAAARTITVNDQGGTSEVGLITSGTWTPILYFGATPTGAGYLLRVAKYTKISTVVYFTIQLVLDGTGSLGSGFVFISLPFTSANDQQLYCCPVSQWVGFTTSYSCMTGEIGTNSQLVTLIANGNTYITNTTCTNNMGVYMSGWYNI